MWQKLSIRTQLLILTSGLMMLVTLATLPINYYLDREQRETLAIELSETLNKSMSQDMLKVLLSNTTDTFSDLSYRLSQFESLDALRLVNEAQKPIFEFNAQNKHDQPFMQKATATPQFESERMYVKLPVVAEGHTFGFATYMVDLSSLNSQLNQQFLYIFLALPFELLIGFLIASLISRRYTQPFEALANAMEQSDPTQNQVVVLETSSKNEIKRLFNGFNDMMRQISQTTKQMRFQSEHDQLTGLYNRFFIENALKTALKDENKNHYILISVDIDQFKLINDSAGVLGGDELLKMISRGCLEQSPENAIIARVGGDDFFILLKNTSEAEGILFAEERLKNLKNFRFSWEGQAYSISVSMGLIAFKPFEYTLKELIKAVDSVFYAAKSSGRNKLKVYHPDDQFTERFNVELETAKHIKEALENGPARFELFAQAIVPLQQKSEKISYEILIRMWDADNNFIPPDSFLPTAERYQMMAEIDMHVLWQFLTQVTEQPEHIEKLHIAHVNLAGSSLNNPDFQAKVKEAVSSFHFPWHKLELEITETSAVGNFNQAKDFIDWLKRTGIGLALDDFGTGMSSFEYLKSLPFDVVKIDGSFVKDMHTDPSDKAVIRYIHEISELRNQETVAEYVETQEDVDALTEIGITYGQGYFLGKPKPLSDWLKNV